MKPSLPIRLPDNRNLLICCGLAVLGAIFLLLTLLRLFSLQQGAVEARLVITMLMGAIFMLAIALLRREGCDMLTLLAALLPLGLAFYLRSLCLDHITLDYVDFLSQWVDFFRENGGLAGIQQSVGNYNVPYLYFLALIAWLPLPDLYLIKLFSILFDVLLAWGCMRIVRVFRPQSRLPEACFLLILLLPTILLNGALWAQCDSVYAALCVLSLASVLEDHPRRCVVLAALAFSFKLQSVFFLPVLLVCWFTRRVAFRQLLLFPAAYFLSILPAVLLGKPLGDILGIYVDQAGAYDNLTLNAPSLFSLLPAGTSGSAWSTLGILLAGLLTAAVLLLLFLLRRRVSDRVLLTACTLLCLLIPCFLPHMHERYFALAEALSVVLACVLLRRFYIPLLIQVASLGGYYAYLMLRYAFPMALGSLMMLAALAALGWDLWRQLGRPYRVLMRLLRHYVPHRQLRSK